MRTSLLALLLWCSPASAAVIGLAANITQFGGVPVSTSGVVDVGVQRVYNIAAVAITTGSISVSGSSATVFQGGSTPWNVVQSSQASQAILSFKSSRSDTYTTTASGTTVDVSASPTQSYAVQVKGTGASATTWDVRLEGSLDGTNFTQILQHTNTTGDATVLYSGTSLSPSLYFRSRCAGLVLGGATNIVVTIVGVQ